MKKILFLISVIHFTNCFSQTSLISETTKLINDINLSEKRTSIYMVKKVNLTWKEFFNNKPKDEKSKHKHTQKIDTIRKYIGGEEKLWLKNIPAITEWDNKVNTKEFIIINESFNIDTFYKNHNSTGVYFYSEPLFNKERNKAIIYIWYISGSRGITALYYYCEKEKDLWNKKKVIRFLGGFYS